MSLVEGLPAKVLEALGTERMPTKALDTEPAETVPCKPTKEEIWEAECKRHAEQMRRDAIVERHDCRARMGYLLGLINTAKDALEPFATVDSLAEYNDPARNQLRRAIRALSDALIAVERANPQNRKTT